MVREFTIVRPRAWSMHTEFHNNGEIVATLSGPKGFGRKAVATVGDDTLILSTGGRRRLISKIREPGALDDIALMEHSSPTSGKITLGNSSYELSRVHNGNWDICSMQDNQSITIVRDDRDPSHGNAIVNVEDDNALILILLVWFALRTIEY